MYSGPTQVESSRSYSYHEHHVSNSNDYGQNYPYARPPLELPRPSEARPPLQTSLSDTSGLQTRNEAFHGPLSPRHLTQGQTLPGLREILSPGPDTSRRQSFSSAWSSTGGPPSTHQNVESYFNSSGLHPPMALYPPSELGSRYQTPQTRAFEVPILQTSPVGRHPPQSLSFSPYAGHREPHRDRPDAPSDRHGQASTGPYSTSGYTSPYGPAAPEISPYGNPMANYDRPNAAYIPTSAESGKKYLGVKDVPGEGRFHVYEGGHRIPTHVDGESVNPQWGLTKANKPRKRLALACLDCREKKIKCEPGIKSCVQCEKANRTCRRAPPQSSQTDTSTPQPWPGTAGSPVRPGASTSDPTPLSNRDTEPDPLNKRRTREDPSPPNVPSKKHRSASPMSTTRDVTSLPGEYAVEADASTPTLPRFPESDRKVAPQWDDDPYAIDPELTLHLLDLYFAHINNATYCIYPRGHFLQWIKNYPNKCQMERMVLYAMLAVGSVFADDTLSEFGKQCAEIVGDAVLSQVGKFNLSMVQTKILLGLYHFARGSIGAACGHTGSALRIVTYLRFNTEKGCLDGGVSMAQSRVEFAMSMEQLAERKRRTFWSAFLMDRYCSGATCSIKPQDVFVRLPCTDAMYEQSLPSDAPYLDNDIVDPSATIITPTSPLAPMAWLVLVSAIWGDVVDFVFREPHRAETTYGETYKAFYETTWNRLQGWCTRLPPHLQYNEANLDQSIQQGYVGTFISMHTLHHLSHMRLNRHLRHSLVPEQVRQNIRTAHSHGHGMLQMMNAIRTARKTIIAPAEGQPSVFTISTPFPGYATLAAIDIVSGGEWESSLRITLDEIFGALGTLRDLSKYWNSAKEQLRACEKRYYQIQNLVTRPSQRQQNGAWLGKRWGMGLRLEQDFDPEYDCIYGLGDSTEAIDMYFGAFQEEEGTVKAHSGGLRIV